MKFSEMEYKRLDVKSVLAEYEKITDAVSDAQSFDEVLAAIARHESLLAEAQTMMTLAEIRASIDTTDKFYEAEKAFYDENEPVFEEKLQEFMLALYQCDFVDRLKEKYGELLFINMEMMLKTFSPAIIGDLQRENALVTEYQKLVASAQISFRGETLNISELGKYKHDADRQIRRAAYEAEGGFYLEHSGELDRIFDELVKCRSLIAEKLGFESFTQLAYYRRTRNCYNAEMVKKFREMVVSDIVPIAVGLKERQRERIGVDKLYFYDDVFSFKEGNPKPQGTPGDILAAGRKMYEEMSPETAEFIDFMYSNELLDVVAKKGKAVGGYCTTLMKYKAPFIFSNFNGTSGDVDVLTHEAGHAFAAYMAKDFELIELMNPTMESCECHSMSMEFFAWKWLPLFYGEDFKRAQLEHLADCVTFIPYGSMVDHFQHIMYDEPELTPAQRNEKWAQLEKIYRPYVDFDGLPFYGEGRGWQRQIHIYEYPFYYIDYCLAQTVALKFWALSQKDYADAWHRYTAFVREGGRKTFTQLCETAGIEDPFTAGSLKDAAKTAQQFLENI